MAAELRAAPMGVESSASGTPSRSPVEIVSSEDSHIRAQSEGDSPSDNSEGGQDRRTVIGALGVVLVVGVLLLRRKRGKQSLVVRWRKRS
ncbi:hypothetical protein ACOQFL_20120 [Actinopolyspora sp. H202]|uniref:hypothetical protein n=1 Tax=Actinopolyspora sp. H202 TaxID=1500456 RepID=UPI003EE79E44